MEATKQKRSVRVRARKEAQREMPVTEATAHARHVRISSQKIRFVLDLIRGEDVKKAEAILKHKNKSASEPLLKLLNSATANAVNNFDMNADNLYVAECFVTEGPTLKRMRAAAKGRGVRILKRTSHITMVLKEREEEN